jgi:hypothetical protein
MLKLAHLVHLARPGALASGSLFLKEQLRMFMTMKQQQI